MKIFLDGADLESMEKFKDIVDGFTTNPTLMVNAGVKNYLDFVYEACSIIKNKPLSVEVFSDDFDEMERQARILSNMGDNIYVKIPITNTKGLTSLELIKKLSFDNIKLNVTAVFTKKQIDGFFENINPNCKSVLSIFAGRIADTSRDPKWYIQYAVYHENNTILSDILWASTRQVYNITEAHEVGADIITVTPDILLKHIKLLNKNLEDYSLETVKMFYEDAKKAGYTL